MTVPTPLIVLAGLLLVALILRLLVPSGVFTFSVGGTVGGTGVLGESDLAKRADALVAGHFAASYAGDTSKLPQVLAVQWRDGLIADAVDAQRLVDRGIQVRHLHRALAPARRSTASFA